jgi:hypothetical protein
MKQTVLVKVDTIRRILFRGSDGVRVYIGAYRVRPPQEAAVSAGRIEQIIAAMIRNILFYKRINYIDQPFRRVKTAEVYRVIIA